jgi:hypothetical protein
VSDLAKTLSKGVAGWELKPECRHNVSRDWFPRRGNEWFQRSEAGCRWGLRKFETTPKWG